MEAVPAFGFGVYGTLVDSLAGNTTWQKGCRLNQQPL